MKELKLDLTPENLRNSVSNSGNKSSETDDERLNPTKASTEPLPESERPRKDGPGGE